MVELSELTELFPYMDVSPHELNELAEIMDKIVCQAGNLVFRESEEGDCLYLIKKGEVKISRLVGENKEKLILILGRGMYFGNFSMVNGGALRFTAEALEDSEVLTFRKQELDMLAQKNSAFGVKIMSEVLFSLFNIYREVDAKFINMMQSVMLGQILDNGAQDKSVKTSTVLKRRGDHHAN